MTDNLTAVPAPPAALLPLALAAAWAEQAARVEEADPLRAALLREHAGGHQRALAAVPAPEAATPDPVAATVSALIGLAHDRYATARLARGQRSYERMYQLDGEAIGLAEAAREVRERLAPAWDALAARLAGAEAERDEQAKLYDNALHSAIRAHDEIARLREALEQHPAPGQALTECPEPHPADHRCFDCATDDELAAAIPPFPGTGGRRVPNGGARDAG